MTTDTTTAVEAGDDKTCPKCEKGTRKDVPDTSIWHCDACGATGDYASGEIIDPQPAEPAVVPDEVIDDRSDVPRNVLPVPAEPDKAGLVSGLSIAPSPDEWERMTAMAVVMSASNIVPKDLRGKPNDVFVILWTGRDLGIPVTTALRSVHVIEGSPSLSPKLRIARVHMLGLGDIVPDPLQTADKRLSCTALALDSAKCNVCKGNMYLGLDQETMKPIPCEACHTTGHRIRGEYTYTWAMAKAAGALSAAHNCTPDNHECSYTRDGRTKYHCKDNWRSYPDRMLWWRAGGYLVDTVFPEAGMGLYSPDELGAVTDEDGAMISVETVELPPGYEASRKAPPPPPTRATDEQITDLRDRILALPDDERAALKERWDQKGHEGRLNKLDELWSTQVAIATALVSGAEANAKAKGWKPPEQGEATGDGAPPPGTPERPDPPPAQDSPSKAQNEPQALTREQQLDLQRGKAEPIMTDDIIDRARAAVEAMTSREIGDELRTRGHSTGGNAGHRHDTLGREIARELAAADHAEANLAS